MGKQRYGYDCHIGQSEHKLELDVAMGSERQMARLVGSIVDTLGLLVTLLAVVRYSLESFASRGGSSTNFTRCLMLPIIVRLSKACVTIMNALISSLYSLTCGVVNYL